MPSHNPTRYEFLVASVKAHGDSDECLIWPYAKTGSGGYGWISYRKRGCRTHRVAYSIFVKIVTDDVLICHTCDNPPCYNPNHLFEGTHLVNTLDMLAKNRMPHGEAHPNSKLTEIDVLEIRNIYRKGARGDDGAVRLAKRFGVNRKTIFRLVNGTRWAWNHTP